MTLNEVENVLMNMADLAERVPEDGEDFGLSVMDRAQDILDTVRKTGRVTGKQEEALMNMHRGLEKWVRK